MLSCRDRAMQHCQQAPVSNEFSTAVLADSIAARGERYLFSITVAPGSVMVALCHGIIWPGGPFPSLTLLVLHSKGDGDVSLQTNPDKELATCPTQLPLCALPFCICTAGFTFKKTGVSMGHSCTHAEDTSPRSPSFCRCLIVSGLPHTEPAAWQGSLPPLLLWR